MKNSLLKNTGRGILLSAAILAALMQAAPVFAAEVTPRRRAATYQARQDETMGPGVSAALRLKSMTCPAGLEESLWHEAVNNTLALKELAEKNAERVNAVRAAAGLPPLTVSTDLSVIAAYRCAYMRKYLAFSHYDANGVYLCWDVNDRYLNDGAYLFENYYYRYGGGVRPDDYLFDQMAAEIEAEGQAWLEQSAAHYANMTSQQCTEIGIGFSVAAPGEQFVDTIVQIFR